jgi:2-polyprenyl-3-methyl-5-hydroxy-6-metoxy-1,4-benzoquinol methylase
MEIHSPKEFIAQMQEMIKFMERLHRQEYKIPVSPQTKIDQLKELTELRMLAKSDSWPKAVEQEQIMGDSEQDKINKAMILLMSLIKMDIENKTILELGCDEGYSSFLALKGMYAKKSVGYDKKEKNWDKFKNKEGLHLTTDWEVVQSNGPYDIIFVNDLIDHSEDFEKELEKIKTIKTNGCRIFVRCHPWCSRHGMHLHNQLNKAYIHLVFSEDELFNMGIKCNKTTHRLLDPITSYKKLFQKTGFSILSTEVIKTEVENFFIQNEAVMRRIKEKWQTMQDYHDGSKFPREFLEIEAVDFILI